MSVTVELLMATDKEADDLVRKPARWKNFLEKNWSGAESGKDHDQRRSMGIRNIGTETASILCGGRSPECLPLGFLTAGKRVIANVLEAHRMEIGDEIVQWNDYDNDLFGYGPPSAFISKEVTQVRNALEPIDDAWVRASFDPDQLLSDSERGRFTASDIEERIHAFQESVRELKHFISRSAAREAALIQFVW